MYLHAKWARFAVSLAILSGASLRVANARDCPYGPPCFNSYRIETLADITIAETLNVQPTGRPARPQTYEAEFNNLNPKYSEKLLSEVPDGGTLTIRKTGHALFATMSNLSKAELLNFAPNPDSVK